MLLILHNKHVNNYQKNFIEYFPYQLYTTRIKELDSDSKQ